MLECSLRPALNMGVGRPMKASIFSITQGDRHFLSFLTQAAGLMADLDLGTEHLRWMGDGRFILGYLQGGKQNHHLLRLHVITAHQSSLETSALSKSSINLSKGTRMR